MTKNQAYPFFSRTECTLCPKIIDTHIELGVKLLISD